MSISLPGCEDSKRSTLNPFEFLGEHRNKESSSQDEIERIRATRELIPAEVKSVLDVGCGDGRIIRALSSSYKTVGVDYAFSSIAQVEAKRIQGSSGSLPFRSNSFDLVLCCEVLEHLEDKLFLDTVSELMRVSRQYILISVPYRENLRRLLTKCPKCKHIFHIWGHCRSFSESKLDSVFTPLCSVSARFSGKRPPYFNPMVLWLNQTIGNRWAEFAPTTMCPECRNTRFQKTNRNVVTVACALAHSITNSFPVSSKNWIIKLYAHHE